MRKKVADRLKAFEYRPPRRTDWLARLKRLDKELGKDIEEICGLWLEGDAELQKKAPSINALWAILKSICDEEGVQIPCTDRGFRDWISRRRQ